jgi:hypothetical protein
MEHKKPFPHSKKTRSRKGKHKKSRPQSQSKGTPRTQKQPEHKTTDQQPYQKLPKERNLSATSYEDKEKQGSRSVVREEKPIPAKEREPHGYTEKPKSSKPSQSTPFDPKKVDTQEPVIIRADFKKQKEELQKTEVSEKNDD